MSRLPNVERDQLSESEQEIYDHIGAERKEVANVFKVLMNSPSAALAVADVGAYVRFHAPFKPALRELVILTVARQFDSQYEWSQHEQLALKAGASPDSIESIRKSNFPANLNADEAITLKFAVELVSRCAVSDGTFKSVLDKYGKQGTTDLVVLIGYYTMLAHCISTLQPDIDPGLKSSLPFPDLFSLDKWANIIMD